MPLAHGHVQGLAAPVAPLVTGGHLIEAPQHQVELATVECFGRQVGGQVLHVHAQMGRLGLQAGQQAGHAQLLGKVGEGDTQLPVAEPWIEAVTGAEGLLDLLQGRTDRAFQGQGPWRGAHVPADAHQQGVAQQVAQARQGIAHGWLGQRQALGSTRYVLFTQQHVQHAQQVEIEVGDIHVKNTWDGK